LELELVVHRRGVERLGGGGGWGPGGEGENLQKLGMEGFPTNYSIGGGGTKGGTQGVVSKPTWANWWGRQASKTTLIVRSGMENTPCLLRGLLWDKGFPQKAGRAPFRPHRRGTKGMVGRVIERRDLPGPAHPKGAVVKSTILKKKRAVNGKEWKPWGCIGVGPPQNLGLNLPRAARNPKI